MSQFNSDSRTIAHQMIDWIMDYRENIESYSVFPNIKPGDTLNQIPKTPNIEPHQLESIFNDFKEIILPGITHWQHPKFFGYFPANSSAPSMFAEILIAALGVQCMSWITSPAATELETRMMEWLKSLFGIPEEFSGVIQDSGSISTLIAVITARESRTFFKVNEDGPTEKNLIAYCSIEAHSSIEKAIKIAGIGRNNLRKIPVNFRQEIRLDLLRAAILEDLKSGNQPFLIVGAFGTTGSNAIDNLEQISIIAKEYALWFHVDAAFAGAFLALPECRHLANGINFADSIVINPHKGLFTTFECSTYFVRDRELLLKTFSILPEYLKTPQFDSIINYRDWGIGLSRRFRALKLWFVLRCFGTDGIQNKLRHHLNLASKLESWMTQEKDFEIMSPLRLNLLCFRYNPKSSNDLDYLNTLNMQLLELLNSSGKLFLTHTKLDNQIVLRMLIGQTDIQEHHVQGAWMDIQEAARSLLHMHRDF